MKNELGAVKVQRLTGREAFVRDGRRAGPVMADFWAWSVSDLVSNATRGRLAEFVVGMALGCDLTGVRDEWQAWDLEMKDGTKVEVKSAGYVQSWSQRSLSKISFSIRKSLAWDRGSNIQAKVARRQADVYVFALHDHKVKATINPLDLGQWRFWVVPTATLDRRARSQHSITLKSLEAEAGPGCGFADLGAGLVRRTLVGR